MRQRAAICLYRALLRECRRQLVELFPGIQLNICAPVNSAPGSYNANATPGLQYQLEALDGLVPGLEVLPEQLPLSYQTTRQLIRDNFHNNRTRTGDISAGFTALDQGFAALRVLPLLSYLQSCSSRSSVEDITIEATSAFSHVVQSKPLEGQPEQHWFRYRIRITNNRQHPVKVLGRGWVVSNHLGELEGHVGLSADNAIVGQQPVIPPGRCFEYHSITPLRAAGGPGRMEGQLIIDVYDGSDESEAVERVKVPVAPFKLQTMAVAGAAAGLSRKAGSSNSSSRPAASGSGVISSSSGDDSNQM